MVRTGRTPKYAKHPRTKDPIIGLSQEKKSKRYYATGTKLYFGTDFDTAIMRFRRWQAEQRGNAVVPIKVGRKPTQIQLPIREDWSGPIQRASGRASIDEHGLPTVPIEWSVETIAHEVPAEWKTAEPGTYDLLDEDAFFAKVRELILTKPTYLAERCGIPEVGYLTDLKPPEPSLRLAAVLTAYISGKKRLSEHEARKTKMYWREFVKVLNAKVLHDVTADDIERFHDHVWETAARDKRSPTWINHRLQGVRTVLRYSLKKGKDLANVRRVLDLTEVFEYARKNGVDPNPISREHFNAMLAVCDVKWRAVMLLGLNCVMYPKEIAELRKSEIDLDKKVLVTQRGKTNIVRCAVLWDRTIDAVRDYFDAEPHNSEFVFVSATGQQYDSNHIGRNFRRRRTLAKLPESVTMDTLRDGGYSAAIERGADLQTARLLAGHQCGISDAYVRRNPKMVATACEMIELHYFGETIGMEDSIT